MIQPKTQLQKINTILSLLTDVNRILTHPATQSDQFQYMQFERQKQQYLAQLTELLSMATESLQIMVKRSSRAA